MFTFLTWDWKESPEAEEVQAALDSVFDPTTGHAPAIAQYSDGSDQYVWIVSTTPLNEAEINAAYMAWTAAYDEGVVDYTGAMPDSLIQDWLEGKYESRDS